METEIKTTEEKIYKFNEDEQKQILKRILKDVGGIGFYWNYDDSLSEEQIFKILTEEDGLSDVENSIFIDNLDYISEEINNILKENLTEEEKTDDDLREFLRMELEGNYNLNFKDLLKNSSIRLRIELNTNEEYMYMPEYKKTEYYKLIKKVFKGCFKVEDLNKEIDSFIGSDYGLLTFFFEVSGERIIILREEINHNVITLKNEDCGFFNSWMGCGGYLDLKLLKEITLKINNWTEDKNKKKYYNIKIVPDSSKYGIQETYGLTSECWKEY